MSFINILTEIIVLVMIIILGFICNKLKLFNQQFSQIVSGFVIKITLPLLIIVSMSVKYSTEILKNAITLIVISCSTYFVLILVAEVWTKITNKPHSQYAVLKWSVIFGNCSFMGYPIVDALYGGIGVFYASVFNIVYIFLLFSYGVVILKKDIALDWKSLLNPGLIATIIGFALFLFQITLPHVIMKPMQMVSGMTIPLALLVTGINLAQIPLRELIRPADIWVISLIRLVAFPVIMMLILPLFVLNQYLIAIPVILMGTPVALTAGAFAMNYGCDHQLASKGVVLSNFLSVITLPVVIWAIMK